MESDLLVYQNADCSRICVSLGYIRCMQVPYESYGFSETASPQNRLGLPVAQEVESQEVRNWVPAPNSMNKAIFVNISYMFFDRETSPHYPCQGADHKFPQSHSDEGGCIPYMNMDFEVEEQVDQRVQVIARHNGRCN